MKNLKRQIKTFLMSILGEHNFPTSYQCVDMIVLDREKKKILLGRRKNKNEYRFLGGFVDPKDLSLENAAKRELREEAGDDLVVSDPDYIFSVRVVDPRWTGKEDQILTAVFLFDYIGGTAKGSDDIEETYWVSYRWFIENYPQVLAKEHLPIGDLLINKGII